MEVITNLSNFNGQGYVKYDCQSGKRQSKTD